MAGDHCEMCAPFYYGKVIGLPGDCTPCTCPHRPLSACDDECVGALLNDLDTIGDAVLSLNLTGVSSAPYGILSSLENTTKYFQPTPKFGKANSYEKLEKLEGPFATLYKGKSK
ncbi:Laminin subunit alpha-1 [Lemmus lemmus]